MREKNQIDNPFKEYVRKQRMARLKLILAIMILTGIWYLLIGREIMPQFIRNIGYNQPLQRHEITYYKENCSEANLVKMLVLAQGLEVKKVGEEAFWYTPYYQQLETLHVGNLQEKNAFTLLSYSQLKQTLRQCFEIQEDNIGIEEKETYTIYEVMGYLEKVLEKTGKGKIEKQEVAILATPSDEVHLGAWELLTEVGPFYFEGLIMAPLKNKTVEIATVGKDILGITAIKDNSIRLEDCKMIKIDKEQATCEILGSELIYKHHVLEKEQEGARLDLHIIEDEIVDYKIHQEEDTPYKTLESDTSISVVLTNDKGEYIQDQVMFQADEDYQVICGQRQYRLPKGEVWDSQQFEWPSHIDCIKLVPQEEESFLLTDIKKRKELSSYRGSMEVHQVEEGIVVINKVNLEEYVAGVILSEMPSDYGIEALKAQAVAARTYAISCLEKPKYLQYGGDVDDTVSSQVYNHVKPDEQAYKAVSETAGLVLKYKDHIVADKFFATSCGYTANAGEVWASEEFPGKTPDYLRARKQFTNELFLKDLSANQDFDEFIALGKEELEAYDEDSPWFRWQVKLTQKELEDLILPSLKEMIEQHSPWVQLQTLQGESVEMGEENLEEIQDIIVERRGEGGNIMSLLIKGKQQVARVETEYRIRSLFKSNPQISLTIKRNDESLVEGVALLPSAFFSIKKEKDNTSKTLLGVTLRGGGYGHGVGMSQDGARKMAEEGKNFQEILTHYYTETKIVSISGFK